MRQRISFAFALLVVAACSTSSSTPGYTKTETREPSGTTVIRIESVADLSERDMRRALFTEAARSAVDRGDLYIRVDEVRTSSGVDVTQQTSPQTMDQPVGSSTSASPPLGLPQPSAATSFSRHRSGTIRFTSAHERMSGERVWDASQLLDQVHAGNVPTIP